MKSRMQPNMWGLDIGDDAELELDGIKLTEIAHEYGTPTHVVNQQRLGQTASAFEYAARVTYPGKVNVHYAFKCNSLPSVLKTMKQSGLKAEVTNPFELYSALLTGFKASDIIVNGPCKTHEFLMDCVKTGVRFIVIDSLSEITDLQNITQQARKDTHILLRINPDYIPAGMNSGTATGSRSGCAFGLDLKSKEPLQALSLLKNSTRIHFHGFHMHIGTGIRNPKDYTRAIFKLKRLITDTIKAGFCVKALDIGGGFASFTTRELTSTEMLVYQGLNRFPESLGAETSKTFTDFTSDIALTIRRLFPDSQLPELIYEPGRSIASPNQFLLLTVHRVKNRPQARNWLITDGGLGTVTMPTYYEYHEVFLCNDPNRPLHHKVTITGPCCFAADIVYKRKRMPKVSPGEILAIMDTGAYFIALESSFGHPRPAVAEIENGKHRLIRQRESIDHMIARDVFASDVKLKGTHIYQLGSKDQVTNPKSKVQNPKSKKLGTQQSHPGQGRRPQLRDPFKNRRRIMSNNQK